MDKIFIGCLICFFVICAFCSILGCIWEHRIEKQISKMSLSEKKDRQSVLFYELEDGWSLQKSMEYKLLLKAIKKAEAKD